MSLFFLIVASLVFYFFVYPFIMEFFYPPKPKTVEFLKPEDSLQGIDNITPKKKISSSTSSTKNLQIPYQTIKTTEEYPYAEKMIDNLTPEILMKFLIKKT